jgi:hypothetical protein
MPELTVLIEIEPLEVDVPAPELKCKEPPVASLLSPAVAMIEPLAPIVPAPTFKDIEPALPPVAWPVTKPTVPEEPLLEVPVLKETAPLVPAAPAFGVTIETVPLLDAVPNPLAMETPPPVSNELSPAARDKNPPTEDAELVLPTDKVIPPATPLIDAPD